MSQRTIVRRSQTSDRTYWVDPKTLPDSGADVSSISGNASDETKRLVCNVFASYGVGEEDAFGAVVGKSVRFVEMSIVEGEKGRIEAVVVCEVAVTKHMMNGAGAMHGGCIAYLVDNCASTPLIVSGLQQNVNGVGVTQNLQVSYHSPVLPGGTLRIVSRSVALGSRIMSARCEIVDKETNRIVASAFISKMQPLYRL